MAKLSDYQKKKFAQIWAKQVLTDNTIIEAFNEGTTITDHLIVDGDMNVLFKGCANYNQSFNYGEDEFDPMTGNIKELKDYEIQGTLTWDDGDHSIDFVKGYRTEIQFLN